MSSSCHHTRICTVYMSSLPPYLPHISRPLSFYLPTDWIGSPDFDRCTTGILTAGIGTAAGIHYIGDIDMAKGLLGAVGDPEFQAALGLRGWARCGCCSCWRIGEGLDCARGYE